MINLARAIADRSLRISTAYNRSIALGVTFLSIFCSTPVLAEIQSDLLARTSRSNRPNSSRRKASDTPKAPPSSTNPNKSNSAKDPKSSPKTTPPSTTSNPSNSAKDLKSSPQNVAPKPNPTKPSFTQNPNGLTQPSNTSSDPNYIIAPRIVPEGKIDPGTTNFLLNDAPLTHLTKWQLGILKAFSDTTTSDVFFNGTLKIQSRIIENLTRNNVYTVDQKGIYFQVRTVPIKRTVTTTTIEPQTMNGLEIQMSLTGACIFPWTKPTDQCTYTPGLVTDRNSIDPKFFVPTRVFQTSQVGDVVKPETLAFMQLPGFQGGTQSQPIGVDFYFPNTGAFPGNSQSQKTEIKRKENIDNTIAGTLSQVRQIVKVNDKEAVLARTIRGFTLFVNDENRWVNTVLQAGAQLLPDVIPNLEGGKDPANTNINRNLFFASNNTRLPSSSFTIYSAGIGRAESLTPKITTLNQIPRANYNSIWLGLSPVIDRKIEDGQMFYQPTGPQVPLVRGGGEGGANSNVQLTSAVNQDLYSTANLQNFHAQVYLSFLQQDVNFVRESTYREKNRYYPHLSLTGNWTGTQDVFRYYTGVIASEQVKLYVGADYTKNTVNGWSFRGGAIAYVNPDRDYYSQIWGSVAKTIPLGKNANLNLSTRFNYAIDQPEKIGDVVSISPASEVAISAGVNWGIVSMGLTNYVGGILPNSYKNRLVAEFSIRPTNNLILAAYIAPIDQNTSRSLYGAGLIWQLDNNYNSPTLSFNWQNQQYDYGKDVFGNNLLVNENVFTVLFRIGDPANPFSR